MNEDLFGLDTLEVPDQAMPPMSDEDDVISEKEKEEEAEAEVAAVDVGEDSSSVGSFGEEADNTTESAEDDGD